MYYQKKLVSIANNRIETYTAIRFQGINAQKVKKEDIEVAHNARYQIKARQKLAQIALGGGVISDMGKHDTCEQVEKSSYETLGGDNQ